MNFESLTTQIGNIDEYTQNKVKHYDMLTKQNLITTSAISIDKSFNSYWTWNKEELNTYIENLIAIREKIKKTYQNNTIVDLSGVKIQTRDQKFLQQASNYIKSNISSPGLNVSTIMSEMHMSRTQLHRKFKALTGLSTTEFIRTIRLKKAAHLLQQNVDSITQIGYQTGFSDHSYFAKCFKKQYGVSPSDYSKEYHKKVLSY